MPTPTTTPKEPYTLVEQDGVPVSLTIHQKLTDEQFQALFRKLTLSGRNDLYRNANEAFNFNSNYTDERIAEDINPTTPNGKATLPSGFDELLNKPFKATVAKRYIDAVVNQHGDLDALRGHFSLSISIFGTALMGAANVGNVPIINHLLDNGANIDICNYDGVGTALQNAAERGHTEAMHVLLKRGANPNINLSPYRTILGAIVQHGDKATYDLVIDRIDLSKIDPGMLLADAAAGGNLEILRDLVEKRHINVNSTYVDPQGKATSALPSAVRENHLAAVDYLLGHGAIVTKDMQAALNEGSMVANDASSNGTNAAKDASTILARIRTHVAQKQGGQLLEVDPAFITHYVARPVAPVAAAAPAPATQHPLTALETAYLKVITPTLKGKATGDTIRQGLEKVFSGDGDNDVAAGSELATQLKFIGLTTPGEFFEAKKKETPAK